MPTNFFTKKPKQSQTVTVTFQIDNKPDTPSPTETSIAPANTPEEKPVQLHTDEHKKGHAEAGTQASSCCNVSVSAEADARNSHCCTIM
jgi:hypothetical protein